MVHRVSGRVTQSRWDRQSHLDATPENLMKNRMSEVTISTAKGERCIQTTTQRAKRHLEPHTIGEQMDSKMDQM